MPLNSYPRDDLTYFIPRMIKRLTGRQTVDYREISRPIWWPKNVPWANPRSDTRSDEEKLKLSWHQALKNVVTGCYEFHHKEDLLNPCTKEGKLLYNL